MLVSVYLPTRNRVELLQRAVESVLAQTYRKIELIVVDDASSDGTNDYLCRRANSDPRLIVIRNSEQRGASASRNTAILKSKGKFLTGLDDDDGFLPERIKTFVEYWNVLASKGLRPSCLYTQEVWLRHGMPYLTTEKKSFVDAREMFESNYVGNQIFAPRNHFIGAGLFDEKMPAWQDLEFFIRVLKRFGRAYLLDRVTYFYDATSGDRISSEEKRIREAFEILVRSHSISDASQCRALFLQIFQRNYNVPPGVEDWMRFLRWGGWPKGLLRLMRATVANRAPKPLPLGFKSARNGTGQTKKIDSPAAYECNNRGNSNGWSSRRYGR
jgi:glycosyltransferase involved in cell wall biosynthesis